MAAIDKTYTDKYSDYVDLLNWSRGRRFKCPNGIILNVMDHVYNWWTEETFSNGSVPVMNTDLSIDYFLIKECPLEFVQARLRDVYGEEYYMSVKSGTSEFDKFSKDGRIGTRLKVVKLRRSSNKSSGFFDVEVRDNEGVILQYSDDYDKFIWTYELGSRTASSATCCKSLKSILRKLRKWELPKGSIATVTELSVGEIWRITIK